MKSANDVVAAVEAVLTTPKIPDFEPQEMLALLHYMFHNASAPLRIRVAEVAFRRPATTGVTVVWSRGGGAISFRFPLGPLTLLPLSGNALPGGLSDMCRVVAEWTAEVHNSRYHETPYCSHRGTLHRVVPSRLSTTRRESW